jgi:hypothetical protein
MIGPGDRRYRHGHARRGGKSRTYLAWASMVNRCSNPGSQQWDHYGARGIKVCPEWHDYEVFLADMGEKPKGLSIDRVNVNGDYCPENCRWATDREQQNNRTNNRKVMCEGELMTLADASRRSGVEYSTLYWRSVKQGWPDEALFAPVRPHTRSAPAKTSRKKL